MIYSMEIMQNVLHKPALNGMIVTSTLICTHCFDLSSCTFKLSMRYVMHQDGTTYCVLFKVYCILAVLAVCYINLCPCIWVISLVILWFYEASYIRVLSDMHWMNHALIVVVFWFVWYIGHWTIGHLWDLIPILH